MYDTCFVCNRPVLVINIFVAEIDVFWRNFNYNGIEKKAYNSITETEKICGDEKSEMYFKIRLRLYSIVSRAVQPITLSCLLYFTRTVQLVRTISFLHTVDEGRV